MTDKPDDEFLEDFGASLGPEDLQRLLERARTTQDPELRQLVKQYQTLRRAAADVLALLEERGEAIPQPLSDTSAPASYPLGFLSFLVRDEPRTPSA